MHSNNGQEVTNYLCFGRIPWADRLVSNQICPVQHSVQMQVHRQSPPCLQQYFLQHARRNTSGFIAVYNIAAETLLRVVMAIALFSLFSPNDF